MSVKVVHFPAANLRNIPDMLRRVAQNIEDGIFGDVTAAALVTHAAPDGGEHRLEIFGFGDATASQAAVLLEAGKDCLIDCMLGRE